MGGKAGVKSIRDYINFYYILPCFGLGFLLWYLNAATLDVVYSDYVRLINTYLKDAASFKPYMGADILTRMPVNYLQRLINVKLFGYSTTFDMVLGVLSLFLSAMVLAVYAKKIRLHKLYYILIMVVLFSLNKWEMLTNGSGWVHFLAFALFFWHYLCVEREFKKGRDAANHQKMIWIPMVTILFVAGPYSGTYAMTVLLAYAYICIKHAWDKKEFFVELFMEAKRFATRILAVIIPLGMYIFSRIHSIEDHAGATDRGFMEVFSENPILFPNFFLKTFSSMFVGKEFAREMNLSATLLHVLGAVLIGFYLYAIYLNIRYKLYQKSILPMILIISGGLNHVIITLSRWIFLKDSLYAMSSRYALQFQVGLLGILLSLSWWERERHALADMAFVNAQNPKESQGIRRFRAFGADGKSYAKKISGKAPGWMAGIMVLCIAISQFGFYYVEFKIAPYRKEFFAARKEVALHFESESDEDIKTYMQYRSVEKTKEALTILREQKLNIFRE